MFVNKVNIKKRIGNVNSMLKIRQIGDINSINNLLFISIQAHVP
jgi:hypothetical protein